MKFSDQIVFSDFIFVVFICSLSLKLLSVTSVDFLWPHRSKVSFLQLTDVRTLKLYQTKVSGFSRFKTCHLFVLVPSWFGVLTQTPVVLFRSEPVVPPAGHQGATRHHTSAFGPLFYRKANQYRVGSVCFCDSGLGPDRTGPGQLWDLQDKCQLIQEPLIVAREAPERPPASSLNGLLGTGPCEPQRPFSLPILPQCWTPAPPRPPRPLHMLINRPLWQIWLLLGFDGEQPLASNNLASGLQSAGLKGGAALCESELKPDYCPPAWSPPSLKPPLTAAKPS